MTALWPVVCATGHRPQHLTPDARDWSARELTRVAAKLRDEHGTRIGISGMALGVDTWWAHAVLAAGLQLWAYVPFPEQHKRWKPEDQAEWHRLLTLASRVRYFGQRYDVRLLHARNDGMLLDAQAVTAVWLPGKKDGGTYSAVNKARRLRHPVIHLDPQRKRTSLPTPNRLRELITA
ncbi:hypothetical protein [Micromonospora arborensis]|uniref:hypothetical protein n=1 Tax=Micromonospora arborensis TaxID=2116518 RepID=UPI0037195C2D